MSCQKIELCFLNNRQLFHSFLKKWSHFILRRFCKIFHIQTVVSMPYLIVVEAVVSGIYMLVPFYFLWLARLDWSYDFIFFIKKWSFRFLKRNGGNTSVRWIESYEQDFYYGVADTWNIVHMTKNMVVEISTTELCSSSTPILALRKKKKLFPCSYEPYPLYYKATYRAALFVISTLLLVQAVQLAFLFAFELMVKIGDFERESMIVW